MAIGNQENWAIIFQLVPLDFWVNTPENIDRESPVIRFSSCNANFFHFLGRKLFHHFLSYAEKLLVKLQLFPKALNALLVLPNVLKNVGKKRFKYFLKEIFHNFYDYLGFYCPIVHNWLQLKFNAPRFFAFIASTDLK